MIVLEVYGIYCVIVVILALAILTVYVDWTGNLPPLLDGTPIGSMLDDRDRGFLVDQALAEDAEVARLDALWELPPREPRRQLGGGWRS